MSWSMTGVTCEVCFAVLWCACELVGLEVDGEAGLVGRAGLVGSVGR